MYADSLTSLTGPLNRYLGRKGTIMFCCVFCFASCLGQAFCRTSHQLFLCRLLLGFGIGPKSATIPIYAAESVPSEEIRGALVMTWQLCTALGIMLGYIFTYIFQDLTPHLRWRFMVGSPIVAPAVLFFLMIALPESPRWHLLKARRLESYSDPNRLRMNRLRIVDQYDKAFHALRRLRYLKLQAARDLYTIDIWLRMDPPQHAHASQEYPTGGNLKYRLKASFPDIITLFKDPRCLRAMKSGLIVLSLQQLCGVNVFAYYSSSVVRDSLVVGTEANPDQTADHIALGVQTLGTIKEASANSGIVLVGFRRHKFWSRNRGALSHRQRWPSFIAGPNVPVDELISVWDCLLLRKRCPGYGQSASRPSCAIYVSVLCRLQYWRGTGTVCE